MTVQPADASATSSVQSRYSQKTLRRIKYSRVTRDTVLFIGGLAFIVIGVIESNPVWVAGIGIAVIFGIAAFMRAGVKPAWDRTWSRGLRYGFSLFFLIGGFYFMSFAAVSSGHIGMQGSGVATKCSYVSDNGSDRGGATSGYECIVNVRWTDGTTTREDLESNSQVDNGEIIQYARPPVQHLFLVGDEPVTTWPDSLLYFLAGAAIFLQALFSLGVLIFGTTPSQDAKPQITEPKIS